MQFDKSPSLEMIHSKMSHMKMVSMLIHVTAYASIIILNKNSIRNTRMYGANGLCKEINKPQMQFTLIYTNQT